MTREELIKVLKDWKPELELMAKYNDNSIDYQRYRALDETTKALEQEPCEDAISLKEVIEWLKTKDIIKLSSQEETARRELKALSSIKPQEPCEDCISRQAVIDAIEDDNRNGNYSCFASNNDAECFKDVIRSLSSVTPKPKTDVLDKIRAEIKEVQTYKMFEGEDTVYVERKDVLAIIDKFNAESEDKE